MSQLDGSSRCRVDQFTRPVNLAELPGRDRVDRHDDCADVVTEAFPNLVVVLWAAIRQRLLALASRVEK